MTLNQHFIEQAQRFMSAAMDVCLHSKTSQEAFDDICLLYQANVPFARILCCVYLSPWELVDLIRGHAQDIRSNMLAKLITHIERSQYETLD